MQRPFFLIIFDLAFSEDHEVEVAGAGTYLCSFGNLHRAWTIFIKIEVRFFINILVRLDWLYFYQQNICNCLGWNLNQSNQMTYLKCPDLLTLDRKILFAENLYLVLCECRSLYTPLCLCRISWRKWKKNLNGKLQPLMLTRNWKQ